MDSSTSDESNSDYPLSSSEVKQEIEKPAAVVASTQTDEPEMKPIKVRRKRVIRKAPKKKVKRKVVNKKKRTIRKKTIPKKRR